MVSKNVHEYFEVQLVSEQSDFVVAWSGLSTDSYTTSPVYQLHLADCQIRGDNSHVIG
jgi:hypothetical protein